jgi:hypothetical protein
VVELAEDVPKQVTDPWQVADSAVGKSSWAKYPQVQPAVKKEWTDRRSHEPATEFELFRAG